MRPALDPDLRALLAGMPPMPPLNINTLDQIRPYAVTPRQPHLVGRPVDRREVTVPASDGTPIPLSILRPAGVSTNAPCVYWIHGGGMVMGDRFSQIDIPLEWLDQLGTVVVSVDYRLAPESGGAMRFRLRGDRSLAGPLRLLALGAWTVPDARSVSGDVSAPGPPMRLSPPPAAGGRFPR